MKNKTISPIASAMKKSQLMVSMVDVKEGIEYSLADKMSLNELSKHMGLSFDLSSSELREIPVSIFLAIGQALSHLHYDEMCNMSDRTQIKGSRQFMLDHLIGCKTLREALNKIVEVGNFLNGFPYTHVNEAGGRLVISIDDAQFPYRVKSTGFIHTCVECMLITLHCLINYFIGEDNKLSIPEVAIKRSTSRDASHLAFWRGRIRFGSHSYAMSYDAVIADMHTPILINRVRLESLHSYFAKSLQAFQISDFPVSVRGKVRSYIARGIISQREVSKALCMSGATMRRRLLAEGTTFREERQAVQKELAIKMLSSGLSGADVAEQLGFSDLRSFSRAFKAWCGMTPNQFMERNGLPEPSSI